MHKNDNAEGSKFPQKTGLAADYSKDTKLLELSPDVLGCRTGYPTPEKAFLYSLWTSFESIQDSIYDQSSLEYQMFEVINPILFEIWSRT